MYHYLYEITNKVNGKIYIGVHSTEDLDDGYTGSGRFLRKSQKVHGIENFEKRIISFYDSRPEVLAAEAEIVTEGFIKSNCNYNRAIGGSGGIPGEGNPNYGNRHTDEVKAAQSEMMKGNQFFAGKKHSAETKKLFSELKKGAEYLKGVNSHMHKGKYITPWGEFDCATAAANPDIGVNNDNVHIWCKRRNTSKLTRYVASNHAIFTESDIGKTYAELGFGFKEK